MPRKIVEAIDEDGSVAASYTIVLNMMDRPVTEHDFIAQAKEDHEEDGFEVNLVPSWRVRDPNENDPL